MGDDDAGEGRPNLENVNGLHATASCGVDATFGVCYYPAILGDVWVGPVEPKWVNGATAG